MENAHDRRSELVLALFEALPEPILVVDAELRVVLANRAATELIGLRREEVELTLRQGEALGCLNSAVGCGRGPTCTRCTFRRLVHEALDSGEVRRGKLRLTRRQAGEERALHLLASAFPVASEGRRLAVLALADLQTLLDVRSMLPICAACKKIRTEQGRWEAVEEHFGARLDVDFSHSFCPACAQRLYGLGDPQI